MAALKETGMDGVGNGTRCPGDGIPSFHILPRKPLLLLDSKSEKPYSRPHCILT